MNKKFLSAILFGALMVTSTGTFVSCKDYDDDIDSVSIRPRACFFPLFSFLPLWLHYNLNPLCVQY